MNRSQPALRDIDREIAHLLRGAPRSALQLAEALEVSQPTISRTIQRNSKFLTSFRITGQRTPLYAALRQLPSGLEPRQRIYRCLSEGRIEPFAEVEFLEGGATLERLAGAKVTTRLYEGLPPYMAFAAPTGFLGRQLARDLAVSASQFPGNLRDWGDDHRIAYLFTQGLNLPGNLVFGDVPLQRELELRCAIPMRTADKQARYVDLATALKSAAYGSSAGGEQPKFLGMTEDKNHVLVKFAKRGGRMAALLPLEHLALRCLEEVGVPAAQTEVWAEGDFVFLELQRFDRLGPTGRLGMLSAGAIDDEFFGRRDSWSEFARRCRQARYLRAEDVQYIGVMAAFSELIGNTDCHFENISLLIDDSGEYRGVAPAYDILPMRYAPMGAGVDPDLSPIEPKIGTIGLDPDVWARAARAATKFWRTVASGEEDLPVPLEVRELAKTNLAVVMRFVRPFVSEEDLAVA